MSISKGKKIKAENIRPKVDGSNDFFSWPLYRWVAAGKGTQVFTGLTIKGNQTTTTMYIGRMEGTRFLGRELKAMCFAPNSPIFDDVYTQEQGIGTWVELTNDFWPDYFRMGLCAIFGEYGHEWEYTALGRRKCKHCGAAQYQKIKWELKKEWAPLVKLATEAA